MLRRKSGADKPTKSDGAAFLGRGHSALVPIALTGATTDSARYRGKDGSHPQPDLLALGREIELPAHATMQIATVTLAAPSGSDALDLTQRYRAWSTVSRMLYPRPGGSRNGNYASWR